MPDFDRKKHWENIYQTKELKEVGWYQPVPEISLQLIEQLNLPTNANIIDVGGGDSFLVDNLLEMGFTNISVLDISKAAIERAQARLGHRSDAIKWIISDITRFESNEQYDLWHDRAAFHFLTQQNEIDNYVKLVEKHVKPLGKLIIGTFSVDGPTKCSGIEIKQYSEDSLYGEFKSKFQKDDCIRIDHHTPSGSSQNFVFCTFEKKV